MNFRSCEKMREKKIRLERVRKKGNDVIITGI